MPPFKRRGTRACLISLVKAIRARVRNPPKSRLRGPDHLFFVQLQPHGPLSPRIFAPPLVWLKFRNRSIVLTVRRNQTRFVEILSRTESAIHW